eukprot:Blabericola_migrator_1__8863@NODE_468_length_8228_cov_102_004044_g365_i0_p3_GENE_NODE_468_length_8228_cov_102_004044_g365_i0NODE_468_length_8228_cov_102_004044_g365_i0_p3_ORF_typecomplete_len194_score21_67_NODE_468_length_8228_cov_102_004044_g365_i015042085
MPRIISADCLADDTNVASHIKACRETFLTPPSHCKSFTQSLVLTTQIIYARPPMFQHSFAGLCLGERRSRDKRHISDITSSLSIASTCSVQYMTTGHDCTETDADRSLIEQPDMCEEIGSRFIRPPGHILLKLSDSQGAALKEIHFSELMRISGLRPDELHTNMIENEFMAGGFNYRLMFTTAFRVFFLYSLC